MEGRWLQMIAYLSFSQRLRGRRVMSIVAVIVWGIPGMGPTLHNNSIKLLSDLVQLPLQFVCHC